MLNRSGAIILLIILLPAFLFSQDANYWTNQYGPGGYFLPGAVVADNNDSGVLYINPALLVNSRIGSLSANATIYHTDNINIINGAGNGFNLKENSSGAIPSMVAGNFRLPLKSKIIISYGLIQPPNFSYEASQRRDDKFNVLNDQYSPGPESFVGQYLTQNYSSDFKVLASAGLKLSNRLSTGFTLEGTRHAQTLNIDYYARAIVNPGAGSTIPLVNVDASYYAKFTNVGLVIKAGLAWDAENNHAGIMITSPTIHLGGNGTLLSDNLINNIDLTETGKFPLSFFANARQENLPVKFKTPISIAAGYTHDFTKWQLYGAMEYFSRINEYNIITPRADFFIRPDTGTSNLFTPEILKLKEARQSVLNFAIGTHYRFTEKVAFYFAVRSDFTYADSSLYDKFADGFVPNTTQWNIYHIQVGVNLKRSKYNLRTGIYTSLGSTKRYIQGINFDDPSEINFLQGNPIQTKARYFSLGLMISYVHNF